MNVSGSVVERTSQEPGVDEGRPIYPRPYQPRESEHSAGEVAVESTTRQLASHDVAFTRFTDPLKL